MNLVDIKTLARILSVKQKTIYDWIHKGYIPFVKLGRLVRFDENEIKKWLENKKLTKVRNISL